MYAIRSYYVINDSLLLHSKLNSNKLHIKVINPTYSKLFEKVVACTYQAISGAGKTFDMWPEMIDNVIPLIPGEEEKSEKEPHRTPR